MLKKATAKIFERFENWLKNRRHFIFSWYTKDAQVTSESKRSLIELPPKIRQKLVDAVENLPINPADHEAVVSGLDEAFTIWQEDPRNANNSVVILSSPVTPVSRILSETLPEWAEQKQVSLRLLPFTSRPDAIESIKSKLEHYIEEKSTQNYSSSQKSEIIVIPNLSWCFLRSLEGLEGIDYLRSLLCNGDQNRFWIIGSGQICWEYLNLIYNLEAYCGQVNSLPEIAPDKLQEWLDPIIDKLKITFDKPRIDQQLLDDDKDNQAHYFDVLADITQGVSIVAVQEFLKSIYCQEVDDDSDSQDQSEILIARTPKLEKLPAVESIDHYLLYSLLLHEDLTISALAESLGDEEAEVQARVQMLRQQSIIKQRQGVLKVNPIYYPQLQQELEANNFFVNKD
ncbi:MAG: hypothetical protein AAFQ80_17330 [Cyanobacteria bacterium J06621_8]